MTPWFSMYLPADKHAFSTSCIYNLRKCPLILHRNDLSVNSCVMWFSEGHLYLSEWWSVSGWWRWWTRASRMWLWPRPLPWRPGAACPRPCHSPTWSRQRRLAAVCCTQMSHGVPGRDPPKSKRTDIDREWPSTAWSDHTFNTNSGSHLIAFLSPARPLLLMSAGQSFIWISYLLISELPFFKHYIHQRIQQNTMHRSFHKNTTAFSIS